MKIQSKRVWIADQFVPAILEFEDTIKHVYPYGTKDVDIDIHESWWRRVLYSILTFFLAE